MAIPARLPACPPACLLQGWGMQRARARACAHARKHARTQVWMSASPDIRLFSFDLGDKPYTFEAVKFL